MSQEHVDEELRGLGMAALHEHEVSVSDAETESALRAVRARLSAEPVQMSSAAVRTPGDRPWWGLFAAAAAVVALIAGVLVIAFGGSDDDTIVPATAEQPEVTSDPTTSDPVTSDPTTSDPTVAETVPPTTEVAPPPATVAPQTISVDAANPPPLIEPVVYASVPLEPDPNGNGVSVAIAPDGIVVRQPNTDFVTLIGPRDVTVQNVPVPADVTSIVAGPGPVIYGLGGPVFDPDNQTVPRGFRFVAVPFLGDRVGEVLAETEVGLNDYLELPPFFFGHGPSGVIDRGRQVGRTVIEYVDETGAPLDPIDEFPIPAFVDVDGDGFRDAARGLVEVLDSDLGWQLDIRRDPGHAGTSVGPSPLAPTTGGRVIYFERIGADLTPDQDFGPNALPVIAILNPDGTGSWVRLPEDWDVVASDVWGTVLMRRTDNGLEFALLDDSVPPAPDAVPSTSVASSPEPVGDPAGALVIPRNCVSEFDCTQLASTEDGRIVAFDPTDVRLRVYDSTGQELQAEVPIDGDATPLDRTWFVGVGPDDVAYLSVPTPEADVSNDLLAVPLIGPSAGTVVSSWTGLDGSGDSTLVPRRAGLTVVPCCGERLPRPAPDAPIYRWVDRNGEVIESTAPSFDLTLGDAGSSLTRIDGAATFTRFTLPTVFQYPRDFPTTIATDDGGALSSDFVQTRSGGVTVLVDFDTDWPDLGIDNGDVYYQLVGDALGIPLLEPSGTVIVADGDVFVRRSLDEIATPGWPGAAATDVETGAVTASGLNEYITEQQPFWADDPELFAYQITSWISPNERVTVDYDDSPAPVIDIITTGFLDDSVAASRVRITTERGADGLLRFVSGTYAVQCQPGRGHQDFSLERCV